MRFPYVDSRNRPFAIANTANRNQLSRYRTKLRIPEKPQVEGHKHQDNANIHQQSFPKSISEKNQIYANDDGYHYQDVHDRYALRHFKLHLSAKVWGRTTMCPTPLSSKRQVKLRAQRVPRLLEPIVRLHATRLRCIISKSSGSGSARPTIVRIA